MLTFPPEWQFIQTRSLSVKSNGGHFRTEVHIIKKMESNGIGVLPHLSQSFQLRSDGKCHSYNVSLLPKDRHFSGPFSAAVLHPSCVGFIPYVRSVITSLITLIHYPMEVNFNPVEAASGGIWQVACSKLICWQTPPISQCSDFANAFCFFPVLQHITSITCV